MPKLDYVNYRALAIGKGGSDVGLGKLYGGDLSGKSLLHIGCRDGELCLEALQAGAVRVVGIDIDPVYIRCAKERAEESGLPVEFIETRDLSDVRLDEEFDVVVCPFAVDSHGNPIQLLEALAGVSRDVLIVGVRFGTGRTLKKRLRARLPAWMIACLARLPVLLVQARMPRHRSQYGMSAKAIQSILLYRTHRFIDAKIMKSKDAGGRSIVYAQRRRGRTLIVIAGPDGVGKSSAGKMVAGGRAAEVCPSLEMQGVDEWRSVDEGSLIYLVGETADHVVLEYNILDPFKGVLRRPCLDPRLRFLTNFENVYVLTLWAEPDVLRQRIAKRMSSPVIGRRLHNAERVFSFYENDNLIREVYKSWMQCCATLRIRGNWMISTTDGYQECDTTEPWQAESRDVELV